MSASLSTLLTTDDLARLLHKSVHTIRHDLGRNPRSLPPVLVLPGTNRKFWLPHIVEAWLESYVAVPPPTPQEPKQKSKRGAPTKAERIRRQQQVKAQETIA